jgi:hypothetical protein
MSEQNVFKSQDRVMHPGKPEWGPGVVMEDPRDQKVRVLFVEGGEKLLQLSHARLETFLGEDARLDRISVGDEARDSAAGLGPQRARDCFLEAYPEGFASPAYREEDRAGKAAASALMEELLGEDAIAALIDAEDWKEIGDRAVRVLKATKLVVPSERKALATGLEDEVLAEKFSRTLCDLLYGFGTGAEGEAEGLRRRFERYVACLRELRACKWPVATYFLFMRFPQEHLLLRPTFSQRAATTFGFELRYRAEVGWVTYARLLELGRAILKATEDLGATDMFDVQAFIWKITR